MECTGQAALNGDIVNTTTWAQVKAATPAVLGQIIKRSNNASYQICTTAGAMSASEPAFSDTAGVTTTDTTAVWCSLGPVGSFTAGMAPFARLASVFGTNWFAANNTVYVASNHAETQATTISIPFGAGASVLCHNVAGGYPPASADLTTGATISCTGSAGVSVGSSGNGPWYIRGIRFRCGVGISTAQAMIIADTASVFCHFEDCSIQQHSTSATAYIAFGGTGETTIILTNTTVYFGHVTQNITPDVNVLWQSTGPVLATGSLVPAKFLNPRFNGTRRDIVLEALDLSQLTGVIIACTSGQAGFTMVRDCKLNAAAVLSETPTRHGFAAQFSRSSS